MRLYSCDVCGKTINPDTDSQFVWRVDGGPIVAGDESTALEGEEFESDSDSVETMDELLVERESLSDAADDDGAGETLEMHPACVRRAYDVCGGCYLKLANDPLGRESRKSRPFSRN